MRRIANILLLLFVAAGCLWQAGRMHGGLLDLRKQYDLTQVDPLENCPPLVAFTTIALGGFRGVAADWLWLRASRLQEEGKYFELVQLSKWITQLEPRFTEVWVYHAWNLAYNVSVLFHEPEDRWRWVRNGISLLRDGGIFYNAGSPEIYRELGWLFQHKIGSGFDQAHQYYLRAWAREMSDLFDGPAPDYPACAAAARDRDELLRMPGVSELVAQLEPTGADPFSFALLEPDNLSDRVRELLRSAAAEDLLLHLRVRRMKEQYKLDPEFMRKVDEEYGPLDWRLPQAHAIYWAVQGLPFARDFEKLALERMIFQSLNDAFRHGDLFAKPDEHIFVVSPNLDLLPRVQAVYERALKEYPDQNTVRTAHENFLQEAIVILYSYHHMDQARALYEELQHGYPSQDTAGGFEAMIYRAVAEQMQDLSPRSIQAFVEGALVQSFFWETLGREQRATGYRQLAQLCWKQFMESLSSPEQKERMGLPPLEQIREKALKRAQSMLADPSPNPMAVPMMNAEE